MKKTEKPRPCREPHPTLKFETGARVRCVREKGHVEDHFDSFAMRSWEVAS